MGGEITKVVLMCESGYQLKAVRVIIEILLETKKNNNYIDYEGMEKKEL